MSNIHREVLMHGAILPVTQGPGSADDGIAFGQRDGEVVIALTHGGEALFIRVAGEALDHVAGLFADAVMAATRAEVPSLGGCQ